MMVNWRPAHFPFWILKRHDHKRSINYFQQLKQNKLTLSGESDATALFSTVCYTLWHLYWLPQSVNSGKSIIYNFWCKAILQDKGCSGLSYSGTDKILVIHLTETHAGKSIWSDKAISSIFKLLIMVLCSSCDGNPLKFDMKSAGPPV
jgi:hypothetical protein